MVRDLVHPSLYPFIANTDPEVREPGAVEEPAAAVPNSDAPERIGERLKRGLLGKGPQSTTSEGFLESVQETKRDVWGRSYEDSTFQWLPTPFKVDAQGRVQILGEINNLERADNEPFYGALAELFESFLPLFESVYGYCDTTHFYDESLEGEHELPEGGEADTSVLEGRSLRGRELQVITKIIEYRLEEGESFEGVWHVEGMSHENILATGVCTLARDPGLLGGELRFKRAYTLEEAGALFWSVNQRRPGTVDDMVGEGHIPIGSVATKVERLIVFPNSHVHKLSTMSVQETGSRRERRARASARARGEQPSDGEGSARRRIIVFWLVHPEHTITSMADVPKPQDSMSFEEACAVRLQLMEERRRHKQSQNVRAISLCEH